MRLTISLDDALYAAIKAMARADDVSLSAAINALLHRSVFPLGEAVPLPSVRNGLAVVNGSGPLSTEEVKRMEESLDQEYGAKR